MTQAAGAKPARAESAARGVLVRSLVRYCLAGVLISAALFLISGRPEWTRAWVYIGIALGIQFVVGAALHRNNPDLLVERSRMQSGTKSWDKVLAPLIAIVGPLAIWCVAGWEMRMHWPPPVGVAWSVAALAVCILSSALVFWAMLENPFFSATVRIQSERNHVVVDRGPYRYVRHPGYVGAALFTMASPVALGSWWAMVPAAATVAILVLRTALEDATLRAELPGYSDYARRVRARLAPGLW